MYKTSLYLLPVTFALGVLSLSPGLTLSGAIPARADDIAAGDSSGETVRDSVQLDSREQELRRKEQELLQAIELQSQRPDPVAVSDQAPQRNPAGPVKATEDVGAVTILEVRAPEAKPVTETAGDTTSPNAPAQDESSEKASPSVGAHQDSGDTTAPLRELEHHPALKPPQKAKTVPMVPSNRIRTKSFDSSPDGTTAKRVGSFYRIDRTGANTSTASSFERARTVPIQDLVAANSTRPALLTSEELATVRNTSTYLKTGPTRLDSTLLKIPQHSAVTIDHRSGTWYRIKTANGVRGWVPGNALLFEDGMNPRSTVRIAGVQNPSR